MIFTVKYMNLRSREVKIMNNKKPKLSKDNIATAKRLLKYVTETYKARFILVYMYLLKCSRIYCGIIVLKIYA